MPIRHFERGRHARARGDGASILRRAFLDGAPIRRLSPSPVVQVPPEIIAGTKLIQVNAVTEGDVHKAVCGLHSYCGIARFCQSLLAAFDTRDPYDFNC